MLYSSVSTLRLLHGVTGQRVQTFEVGFGTYGDETLPDFSVIFKVCAEAY
jgi:hypothetical protein